MFHFCLVSLKLQLFICSVWHIKQEVVIRVVSFHLVWHWQLFSLRPRGQVFEHFQIKSSGGTMEGVSVDEWKTTVRPLQDEHCVLSPNMFNSLHIIVQWPPCWGKYSNLGSWSAASFGLGPRGRKEGFERLVQNKVLSQRTKVQEMSALCSTSVTSLWQSNVRTAN